MELVLDDRAFDNGPVITRMLRDGREVDLQGRTAHVQSEIILDGEWRRIKNGTLSWKGGSDCAMIRYRGGRCALEDLFIRGGIKPRPIDECARYGVLLEFIDGAPTVGLRCDRVEFDRMQYGLYAASEPRGHHTGNNKFYEVAFSGVRFPVWSENDQFCPNYFYGVEIRAGYDRAFTFKDGGGLHVYGCYVGGGEGKTLLWLPDRTKANNGTYSIQGLHVDGNNSDLTLVSHGDIAHNVHVSGSVNKGGVADPAVTQRLGPLKAGRVVVDCLNVQWPSPL